MYKKNLKCFRISMLIRLVKYFRSFVFSLTVIRWSGYTKSLAVAVLKFDSPRVFFFLVFFSQKNNMFHVWWAGPVASDPGSTSCHVDNPSEKTHKV